MKLRWSSVFTRAVRRHIRNNPALLSEVQRTLNALALDRFQPSLRTHKLKGNLAGSWACSVNYQFRVVFEFVKEQASGQTEVHLLSLGTHDEVY